jgi:hypothetical protein
VEMYPASLAVSSRYTRVHIYLAPSSKSSIDLLLQELCMVLTEMEPAHLLTERPFQRFSGTSARYSSAFLSVFFIVSNPRKTWVRKKAFRRTILFFPPFAISYACVKWFSSKNLIMYRPRKTKGLFNQLPSSCHTRLLPTTIRNTTL